MAGRWSAKGRSDSGGRLYEEIETVAFEDRLHCLRTQERQILVGIGLGGRRQRHWIDDWIMGVVGKCPKGSPGAGRAYAGCRQGGPIRLFNKVSMSDAIDLPQ